MILNTQIWQQTVSAAKVAVSNNSQWLRAIERADNEIRRARYWSFDGSTLTIQSTTSNKMYRVDDHHTCEACANGHRACKHRAARKLMQRYTERLAAAPLSPEPQPTSLQASSAPAPSVRAAEWYGRRSGNAMIIGGQVV